MSEKLIQSLEAAGKKPEIFAMPDGSRLFLLPYGARALGLFAPGSDENFYWTNPEINDPAQAAALFSSNRWHNTGGDRTWISPELDTFFIDEKLDRYRQQRELDMSDYVVARTGGGIQLSKEMTLHLARKNLDVKARLTKWFGPAANPLRIEPGMANVAGTVAFAGYTERVAFESLDKPFQPNALLGIWNLIQMPEAGEMIATIYSPTLPQPCFGDIPADHLIVDDRSVRFNTDLCGSHKVALKASATCGRIAYTYGQGETRSLVIRSFFPNPSGEYIDVQRTDMQDFGYAVQLCRVDEPMIGSFCELEYHAPALGSLPNPAYSEDVSQVWAYRGSRDALNAIAQKLLGVKLW
jgi:hypothetical protein